MICTFREWCLVGSISGRRRNGAVCFNQNSKLKLDGVQHEGMEGGREVPRARTSMQERWEGCIGSTLCAHLGG